MVFVFCKSHANATYAVFSPTTSSTPSSSFVLFSASSSSSLQQRIARVTWPVEWATVTRQLLATSHFRSQQKAVVPKEGSIRRKHLDCERVTHNPSRDYPIPRQFAIISYRVRHCSLIPITIQDYHAAHSFAIQYCCKPQPPCPLSLLCSCE